MQLTFEEFLKQEKNKQTDNEEIGFYLLFTFIYDNKGEYSYCSDYETYLTREQAEQAGEEWVRAGKSIDEYYSYTIQFSPITPIILSEEEMAKVDVLVEESVKWVQKHPSYITEDDNDGLRQRFSIGIPGEMAVAKSLNVEFKYSPEGFFFGNKPDIEEYNLGVKTTTKGHTHLVNTFNKWDQVLCFLKGNRVYIAGVITKDMLNSNSNALNYGSDGLKKRKRRLNKDCYQYLISLQDYIRDWEAKNNEEEQV